MLNFKKLIKKAIFPSGSTVTILRGPLAGNRYVVNEYSGWAHIFGGWEPGGVKAFKKYIRPGDVVFDVGANTGLHSLLFSRLTGPSGKVYAFEPLPENVRQIETLISLNKIKNIDIYPAALSNYKGKGTFTAGNNTWEGHLTGLSDRNVDSTTVSVLTLDSFIGEARHPTPQFIKIDVEGEESKVLEGSRETIEKCHPLLYVDLHNPEQDVRVGAIFRWHGYRVFRVNYTSATGKLLSEVTDLSKGWPHHEGLSGAVLGFPPDSPLLL